MIDHARAQELAAAALDFELTTDEHAELDGHLGTCATCSKHAEALRLDARALAALRRVDAPERVRRRVIRDWRPAWGLPVALAAGVAAVAIVVGVLVSGGLNRAGQEVAVNPTPGPSTSFPAASGTTSPSSPGAAPATPVPRLPTTAWVGVEDRTAFNAKAATPAKDTSSPPPLNCGNEGCGDTAGGNPSRTSAVRATVQAGGTIVAVGQGCIGGNYITCQADVWLSPDARQWEAVPNNGAFDAGADNDGTRPAGMMDVASARGSIVAVGSVAQNRQVVATAWLSGDGREWRPVRLDHDSEGQALAVAAGPNTFVAVGRIRTTNGAMTAAVWTSTDSTSWEPVTEVERAAVGQSEGIEWFNAGMFDVTWADHQFVAVGAQCSSMDVCRTASWTSPDGRAWARAPGRGQSGRMRSVAYVGSRVVAVGDDGTSDSIAGRAWFSSNASAWTSAPIKASGPTGRNPLRAVVAVGTGAIAAGDRYALQSSDGRSWTRADDHALANGSVYGLAATPGGVIATGAIYGDDAADFYESPPAIWVLPYR
jgi:hypothetical protein